MGAEAESRNQKPEIPDHLSPGPSPPEAERGMGVETAVVVERHRTALTRYELSKPVKTLLEYGVLRAGRTFFDYGCGQGSDVRGLQALGYEAEGWDAIKARFGVGQRSRRGWEVLCEPCCFGKHAGAEKTCRRALSAASGRPVGPIAISRRLPQVVSRGDSACS